MKPWEGKYWEEETNSIWNSKIDDDEISSSSLFRDGKQVAHTRLVIALMKDWEEENLRPPSIFKQEREDRFIKNLLNIISIQRNEIDDLKRNMK